MDEAWVAYPTDLDDSQWAVVEPLIPPSSPLGADRVTPMRGVVNAIRYRQRAGCSWRMLPRDFPHWRTVYGYFRQWQIDGTWKRLERALRRHARRPPPSPPGRPHRPEVGVREVMEACS